MIPKLLFPLLFIAGLGFLIKSIGRMIHIYGGKKIVLPLDRNLPDFKLSEPGEYEIAYRRPALWGIIPTSIAFELVALSDHQIRPVSKAVNHLGSRKDLSGSRIVPIAEFSIDSSDSYRLSFPAIPDQKKGDALIIMKKTGAQGFLMIFAILISAIATISGLVLSVLAFLDKL